METKAETDKSKPPMINTKIGQRYRSSDTAKQVSGPNGSPRYQGNDGRFRGKPAFPSSNGLPSAPSPEANVSIDIPLSGHESYGVHFKANANLGPTGASIKSKVTLPILEIPIFDTGTFTVNGATASAQASISKDGIGIEAEVTAASASYDISQTYCMNSQTSLTLNGSLTLGVGVGYSWGQFFSKNKTNEGWNLQVKRGFGEGVRWEMGAGIGINPSDPQCYSHESQPTSFPHPRPNATATDDNQNNINLESPSMGVPRPQPNSSLHLLNRSPAFHENSQTEYSSVNDSSTNVDPPKMLSTIANALEDSGFDQAEITTLMSNLEDPANVQALNQIYQQIKTSGAALDKNSNDDTYNDMKHYAEAFDCLHSLGVLIKCDALTKGGAIGIQLISAYKICMNVSKNFSISIASTIGNIANLASIVMNIIGIFFGGPDPTALILEAINKLSDQIRDLNVEMKNLFRQQSAQNILFFDRIKKGLNDLKVQLNNTELGIRADINIGFSQLRSQLSFGLDNLAENDRTMSLRDLAQLCNEAEKISKERNVHKSVSKLRDIINRLNATLKSTAYDPILNGNNLWITYKKNSASVESLLHIFDFKPGLPITSCKIDLNSHLSFLASCSLEIHQRVIQFEADILPGSAQSKFPKDVTHMPNPLVINNALDSLLALHCSYAYLDDDADELDLEELQTMLLNTREFIGFIHSDASIYQGLIADYFMALKEVQNIVGQYAAYESQQYTELLNRDYVSVEAEKKSEYGIPPQSKVEINILGEDHNSIIKKFIQRRINKISGEIAETDLVSSSPVHFDKKRLYYQTTAKNQAGIAVLFAGEFLQLFTFSARQSRLIVGEKKYNFEERVTSAQDVFLVRKYKALKSDPSSPDPNLDDLIESKLFFNVAQASSVNEEVLEMGRFINAMQCGFGADGMAITPGMLPLSQKPWAINFNISINDHDIINLEFKEKWPGVEKLQKFYEGDFKKGVRVNWHRVKPASEDPDFSHGRVVEFYSSDDEKRFKDIKHAVLQHIVEMFNSPSVSIRCKSKLVNSSLIESYKNLIISRLMSKRQMIARNLSNTRAEGGGQHYMDHFQKSLVRLDKAVLFIKLFSLLSGKNTSHKLFSQLLSSHEICRELSEYATYTTPDLKKILCPSLVSAIEKEVNVSKRLLENIVKLKQQNLNDLSLFHPLRVIEKALQKIKIYRIWKKFHCKMLSKAMGSIEIRKMIVSEIQDSPSISLYVNQIATESYKEVRYLIVNHLKYANKMSAEMYCKCFNETVRFIQNEACSAIYTAGHSDMSYDLDNPITQQWLLNSVSPSNRVPHWVSHLGFLFKFVAQYMKWSVYNEHAHPVNMVLWIDGVAHFLNLLFNDKLEVPAHEAGYNSPGKIAALTTCLQPGRHLLRLIYSLVTEPLLFGNLFSELEKLFTLVKSHSSPDNSSFAPTRSKIISTLAAISSRCIILHALIELTFGKDLVNHSGLLKLAQLKNSAHLNELLYCQSASEDDNSLMLEIESIEESLVDLKDHILQRATLARDLCCFNSHLKKLCKSTSFLGNELLINYEQAQCLRFKEGQILLFDFLKKHQYVSSIKLGRMELTPELVNIIAATIRLQPNIRTLQLSDGQEFNVDILLLLEKSVITSINQKATVLDFHAGIANYPSANLSFGPNALHRTIALIVKAREILVHQQDAFAMQQNQEHHTYTGGNLSVSFFKLAKIRDSSGDSMLAPSLNDLL